MTQKGVVLFTTMIMLSILTLLILSLMQAILLTVKASNQLAKRHEVFYQLEAAAIQLSGSNFSHEEQACTVSEKNPNEVIELLQRHHGCIKMIGRQSYRYLIVDLGAYPCLRIKSGSQLKSSHHWLLSIATEGSVFEVLQLRIARAVDLVQCVGNEIIISEGTVSWKHFTT